MSSREYAIDLQLGDSFRDMVHDVIAFVPKLVAFIAVFVIGWIIAKILGRIVGKLLHRAKFDSLMDRTGLPEATRSTFSPSDLLAKIVYYSVLLLALTLALSVFGPNPVSDTLEAMVRFIPKVIVAIVIAIIAFAVAGMVRDLVTRTLGGLSYGKMLGTLAWAGIAVIGVIAALNQVGVATTVTTPVLIAILATIGGILVVGVGGGLIKPMANRWEGWLDAAQAEARNVKAQVASSKTAEGQLRNDTTGSLASSQTAASPAPSPAANTSEEWTRKHGLAR